MASGWDEYLDEGETTYAQGRMPERTYVSKSFPLERPGSPDHGEAARFIYKVFDVEGETALEREGEAWLVRESPQGRYQVKLLVAREKGHVKDLWIQRVPGEGEGPVKTLMHLDQNDAAKLIEMLQILPVLPVEGGGTVRVDDALLNDLLANPESLSDIYRKNPERFREVITNDTAARDVVAVAARRRQVERFQQLLEDDAFFDSEVARLEGSGPEAVWQRFFESNPWIFGVTLSGQLLTGWNSDRLEQAVVGQSIGSVGKRADALLRTTGRIRSMVFAEIKTHRTQLLRNAEYRSGCWQPSLEVSGGVAQVQSTVQMAVNRLGERLTELAEDGSEIPGEYTYLLRPRSYLVVGALGQLVGVNGGHHADKVRSFELYRRHLLEPEIITFDELLARAQWVTEIAEEAGS